MSLEVKIVGGDRVASVEGEAETKVAGVANEYIALESDESEEAERFRERVITDDVASTGAEWGVKVLVAARGLGDQDCRAKNESEEADKEGN